MTAPLQLSLLTPCSKARQDAAPPEGGHPLLHKRCLTSGGAASSRAGVDGTRLETTSPRGAGRRGFFQSLEKRPEAFPIIGKIAVVRKSAWRMAICVLCAALTWIHSARAGDETPPAAFCDFDDSAWQFIHLPLAPDAPSPWPKHADGTILYRRSVSLEAENSRFASWSVVSIGKMDEDSVVWVNQVKTHHGRVESGDFFVETWRPPDTLDSSVIFVAAPVRNGVGGIFPQDPASMYLQLRAVCTISPTYGEHDAFVTDEWTIPLAGEWKCLFVPDADAPADGGAP